MKKFTGILVFMFILYIVYHDVSHGTLPSVKGKAVNAAETVSEIQTKKQPIPFQTVKIKAGDTVLSIIEDTSNGSIPVPIQTIINDFEILNPNTSADSIKIGKEYKIPLYTNGE